MVYSRDAADAGKEGYSPLLPGQYFVETRWSGSDWQFRVVDSQGLTVAVADLDTPNGLIANWQIIRRASLIQVAALPSRFVYRFDSHRGLILEFSTQYFATDESLVGAMRLGIVANGFGEFAVEVPTMG